MSVTYFWSYTFDHTWPQGDGRVLVPSIVGIAAERWARNLTSRVQIPADPKFQFFLSFLLATLKIWLQIAKPFKKNG
jgi:hypothetical protein